MIKLKNLLVENPVSTVNPPRNLGKETEYGHLNFGFHLKPVAKAVNDLYKLCQKIDIVSTDFDDRDLLKPFYDLGSWEGEKIKEPILTSVKKLDKALKSPEKNFAEPKRVIRALPGGKSFLKQFMSKFKTLSSYIKNFDKFKDQKISKVIPNTKGTEIANKKVGDYVQFTTLDYLDDITKLVTGQSGFEMNRMSDIASDLEYKTKGNRAKVQVIAKTPK